MQKLYCSTKIKIFSKNIYFLTLENLVRIKYHQKFHFNLKKNSTKLRASEDIGEKAILYVHIEN